MSASCPTAQLDPMAVVSADATAVDAGDNEQVARELADAYERLTAAAELERAHRAQLSNVGQELIGLRRDLAVVEERDAAHRDQLTAVGEELAYARSCLGRAAALESAHRAQLASVGEELLDARARIDQLTAQNQALRQSLAATRMGLLRATAPAPTCEQSSMLYEALAPAAYREIVAELEKTCEQRSGEVEPWLRLAEAHLLQPLGGVGVVERTTQLATDCFNPEAAVAALETAQRLAPERKDIADSLRRVRAQAAPPIVLAALPKSGSVFVLDGLATGLGKHVPPAAHGGAFPRVTTTRLMGTGLRLRQAFHTHIYASRTSLLELDVALKVDRILVHVRDPRQAMISWFHYLPAVAEKLDPVQGAHYQLPPDYLQWPAERQLDWQIDTWLPWAVGWIEAWLGASQLPWLRMQILYTCFEDMVREPVDFFRRILDFYEIDRDLFIQPERPTVHGDRNFRRGEVDEWRQLLTPEQVERANAAIPEVLCMRFGWPTA